MSRQSPIEVSVTAHEIVTASRRLSLRASTPLDPDSTKGAVVLQGHPSTVRLSKDGRAASLEVSGDLPAGPQTLRIGELRSTRGNSIAPARELPFFVSDSCANISPALRVESMVRLQVEPLAAIRVSSSERPKGSYIEIMKAVNRKTGKPVELAFDHRGKRIDAQAVFEGIARRRQAEYGKLHPALKAAADDCSASKMLPVAVWLAMPEANLPSKRTNGPTLRPPKEELERKRCTDEIAARITAAMKKYEARAVRVDPHVPVVYCTMPAGHLAKLQKHDEVLAMFLPPGTATPRSRTFCSFSWPATCWTSTWISRCTTAVAHWSVTAAHGTTVTRSLNSPRARGRPTRSRFDAGPARRMSGTASRGRCRVFLSCDPTGMCLFYSGSGRARRRTAIYT